MQRPLQLSTILGGSLDKGKEGSLSNGEPHASTYLLERFPFTGFVSLYQNADMPGLYSASSEPMGRFFLSTWTSNPSWMWHDEPLTCVLS